MKKAVYNSKKERTKKEKTGGENQEGNFRKKIAKGIGNVWIWIFLM